MAKDLDAELVAAFEVVRKKLQRVLQENARLKLELAEAREDIESTVVIIDQSPKPWWYHIGKWFK